MVHFSDRKELRSWLAGEPRRVSVAIAARGALRVLPLLPISGPSVLSAFRAVSVAWVAASWPKINLRRQAIAAAYAADRASTNNAANIVTDVAACAASSVSEGAYATAAADVAAIAANVRVESKLATWGPLSADANLLIGGLNSTDLVKRPLWGDSQPTWVRDEWRIFQAALYEADAGWEVWIDWYNERLNGSPTDADLEIDRVLKVDEETWKSDPKTINSRIKEIIAQFKTQQEKKPLQNIDDVGPPKKPLPDASPATRFVYTHGKFDVVPPSAWAGREGQAAVYHAKALKLATELSQRLLNTDAVPDVAGSVQALADVLGGSITDLQPDQLRLATRSIAARARVYGHQSAEWEISVESVSKLFELSDVLVDIQSFVRVDLDRHEAAIRQLDLDPQSASELKKGLDKLSVAIAESDFVSDKASAAFDLGTEISGSASDQGAKIAIEGDRSLMVGNLALAVARELSRDPVESPTKSEGGSGPSPPKGPSKSGKEDEPRPRRTRARKTGPAPERSWENFSERVVQQVHDKGAEKIGDALVAAAVSAIKYAPATVSGVGATLALWASQYPALATGSVSTTMAWIGYQVWRSQKK